MNQSDKAELVLVFVALLVAIAFGLIMGIGDHFDANRFVATLIPDFGVLFGANVVASVMLAMFFGGLTVNTKLLFDS